MEDSTQNQKYKNATLPRYVLHAVIAISIIPCIAQWLGFDFSLQEDPLYHLLEKFNGFEYFSEAIYKSFAGVFIHTIFEWTAVVIVFMTTFFALIHFGRTGNIVIPTIAIMIFFAGVMDTFHVFAANRFFYPQSSFERFIPFTWFMSRFYVAIILVFIAGLMVVYRKEYSLDEKMRDYKFNLILFCVLLLLGLIAMFVSLINADLPRAVHPDLWIRRPWDFAPLLIFVLGGVFVYPLFYKEYPSLFTHALLISFVPQIFVQLHMMLGSVAFFDSDYNIAHFLKIVAYAVPLVGLVIDQKIKSEETSGQIKEDDVQVHDVVMERMKAMVLADEHKRTDEQTQTLLEALPAAVIAINRKREITFVNASAEKVFGYLRYEMLGQLLEFLVPERHRADLPEEIESFFADKKPRTLGEEKEMYGFRKNRSDFPVRLTLIFLEIKARPHALVVITTKTDS